MWINRYQKSQEFVKIINNIKNQVIVVRGARQVGKTSFVLHSLNELKAPFLFINCLPPGSNIMGITSLGSPLGEKFKDDIPQLGPDFLGKNTTEFIKNIDLYFRARGVTYQDQVTQIFIDEADQYPPILESIQILAEYSPKLKFIFSGSNLENITVKNAATGRKYYFDLYPITFYDFLRATNHKDLVEYALRLKLKKTENSDYYHNQLSQAFEIYKRLGGMPKLLDLYLEPRNNISLSQMVSHLASSIEQNIKLVLDQKISLYEYHDILRTLVQLSANTLQYKNLQVNHAKKSEAKKLVYKTVGARVAHKIRLMDTISDKSKYVLFDSGIANYLLNGSNLFTNDMLPQHKGILSETVVANELIANLVTRDDLFYWKSENKAEIDFMLNSPILTGIDVKSTDGGNQSLDSFALHEPNSRCLVKISGAPLSFEPNYVAKLRTSSEKRKIPFINIPHYLTSRLPELLREL